MNNIQEFEDKCHKIERDLEEVGRMICSVQGGAESWHAINCAITEVQTAIHNDYLMITEK